MEPSIEVKQIAEKPISELFKELLAYEPALISAFVPEKSRAAEQKGLFLDGSIRNPNNEYPVVNAIDFNANREKILEIGNALLTHGDLDPKHIETYRTFIDDYLTKNRLLEVTHLLKHTDDPVQKMLLKDEYHGLNVEIYGEVEEKTYKGLLANKLDAIRGKELTGRAAEIRDELFAMLPSMEDVERVKEYEPEEETKEWVKEIAEELYGNMLNMVPEDKENFTKEELAQLFRDIIASEFGGVADQWSVDIENAGVITVKASEQRVVIPDKDVTYTRERVRGLIAHELGVHMLRSVVGGQTNVDPTAIGVPGYYDFEEGLGVLMAQAIKGKFVSAGIDPYILAGLAVHENLDFHDLHEIKWRLALLDGVKDNEEVTDETIAAKRDSAYGSVERITRGTDGEPWLKDTGYYKGQKALWEYLDSIRGDHVKLMFLLMGGRINSASRTHEQIMLESRTDDSMETIPEDFKPWPGAQLEGVQE